MASHEEKATPVHPAIHIDVFACGRRIGEEMFNRRRQISVGWSAKNAVVLPDQCAPKSLALFHRTRTGYSLHYTNETRGAVSMSAAPACGLSELRDRSKPHHHGYDLALEEGAHGQLEVGDETLVFEVVSGPQALEVPRRWPLLATAVLALLVLCAILFLALEARSSFALPA